MRKIATITVLLAFAAPAVAEDVEQRLDRLEDLLDGRGLAELVRDVERIKQENRELRGDIESLDRQVRRLQERQREHYADLDDRLRELQERGLAQEQEQVPIPDLDGPDSEANEEDADAGELYQAAFRQLGDGLYEDAREGFRGVLEADPESDYAANAVYWIAETYYAERDFEAAGEHFERVIDEYGDSDKVPDARLKLGYIAFEEDRLEDAREKLEAVQADHPDTTAANLAQQRVAEIRRLMSDDE